jgi:hypothetical protein
MEAEQSLHARQLSKAVAPRGIHRLSLHIY